MSKFKPTSRADMIKGAKATGIEICIECSGIGSTHAKNCPTLLPTRAEAEVDFKVGQKSSAEWQEMQRRFNR